MIDNPSEGKKNNINPHLTTCSLRIGQFIWLIYLLLGCVISFVLQSPEVSLKSGLFCVMRLAEFPLTAKGKPRGAGCGILARAGGTLVLEKAVAVLWTALECGTRREGRSSHRCGQGELDPKQKHSACSHPRSVWRSPCSSTARSERLDPASLISTK